MNEYQTILWPGISGREYKYWIYPIGTSFKGEPGNYIFAKQSSPGYWTPCYVGESENLDKRLENHEKESCARKYGATHIHAHLNKSGIKTRIAEEKDLINKWKPVCNEIIY